MLDRLRPPVLGLIVDMDGVLWKQSAPIGDLSALCGMVKSRGLKITLATNNATMTVADNLNKLRGFGVDLDAWQIVTSADATASALCDRFPSRGAVFVLAEDGAIAALRKAGFDVIIDPDDSRAVVAVVAGIDRSLTYQKLSRATLHVRGGAAYYGTNPDLTFPTPDGLIPGAGAILAALTAAAGVNPIVVGKPAPFLFQLAADRMHLSRGQVLVVGDRLETDIDGGHSWGARTGLVLSGVSTRAQLAGRSVQPDLVADDLTQLLCG